MAICIGVLQLVRVIFSLYILHFTFYTLLAPSALKWSDDALHNYHLPTNNLYSNGSLAIRLRAIAARSLDV